MATAKSKAAPAAPKKAAAPVKKVATKAAAPAAQPAKKAAAAKPAPVVAKPLVIKDVMSKTQLLAQLATVSGQDPKAVKAVLGALEAVISASLGKKGPGAFVLPGLMKVTATKVAARKAYTGIDRFTKQERKFAAKPASTKVKVRPLKKLRDAAGG